MTFFRAIQGLPRRVLGSFNEASVSGVSFFRMKHDYTVDEEWKMKNNKFGMYTPAKVEYYNQMIWPPGKTDEESKPLAGCVYHYRRGIKHSPRKLLQICSLVRGLSVEEALKQCELADRKGAIIMAEVIREAIKEATENHNIEYPTNLWITDASAKEQFRVRGLRKHPRAENFGFVSYKFSELYIRLEEGQPPAYAGFRFKPRTGWEKMGEYMSYLRNRKIKYSL